MIEPYVTYYSEVEFGEEQFESWHPQMNNMGRNRLLFVIGIGFKNDPRSSMTLFDFYLVHEDFFDPQNMTPNFPEWIFVGEFSWQKVYEAIESFVETCKANTEEESFEKLRKKFFWEYDGYNGKDEIPPKDMYNYIYP